MSEPAAWISAVRQSHDAFATLVSPLTEEQVRAPSFAAEWSIADTASHLGSQAEIFGLFLDAGLTGTPAPGGEAFGPIWDRWNALPPTAQVTGSVAANEAFVARLESIPDSERRTFAMSMFGRDIDLAGLCAMRLGEHALHTWDIAVALDPAARVPADAVDLLVDTLGPVAARSGRPDATLGPVSVETTEPERAFLLTTEPAVGLAAADSDSTSDGQALRLPAEALVRLVYGRLGAAQTPSQIAGDPRLPSLRAVFPGF